MAMQFPSGFPLLHYMCVDNVSRPRGSMRGSSPRAGRRPLKIALTHVQKNDGLNLELEVAHL